MQARRLGKMTYAAKFYIYACFFVFFSLVLLLYIEGNTILCSVSELNLRVLFMKDNEVTERDS